MMWGALVMLIVTLAYWLLNRSWVRGEDVA